MGRRSERGADANHVILPKDSIVPPGVEGKIKANIRAIQLLKKLEQEDRNPTPKEKLILAQYVGWGAFSQKVFKKEHDLYLRRYADTRNPAQHFWTAPALKAYTHWKKKYGDKLHPKLGGLMTDEEWRRAEISTINAHYTSREVVSSMWALAKRLGFKGGTVLEPAAGVGHFFGLMPQDVAANSQLFGVELDTLSGRILQKLYPQANIEINGFEKSRTVIDNSIDLVITNVPFADIGITDKRHPDYNGWKLHNYFLARSLTATKPGGIVMAITSSWSMDAKTNGKVREYLALQADLIGAIRLPNTAFKANAGTEVVTDILVFRKKDTNALGVGKEFRTAAPIESKEYKKAMRDLGTAREALEKHNAVRPVKGIAKWKRDQYFARRKVLRERVDNALDEVRQVHPVNEYFHKHPEMVLGKHSMTGTMYAKNSYTVKPTGILPTQLAEAIATLPKNIAGEGTDLSGLEKVEFADLGAKEGTLVYKGGNEPRLVQNGRLVAPQYIGSSGKVMFPNRPAQVERIKRYMELRNLTATVINAMGEEATTDAQVKALQERLNRRYDDFVSRHGRFNMPGNSFLRKMDNDFAIVDALEIEVGKGKERKIVKAPIFSRRTVFPFVEPSAADSLDDAASLSLIYRGELSAPYVASLLGETDLDAVKARLVEKGLGFINPDTGTIEAQDLYLSGNVKKKLIKARLAAEDNADYEVNVRALEKVIPEDIDIEFISFRLGSSWVPAGAIQDFFKDVLEVDTNVQHVVTSASSRWVIEPLGSAASVKNQKTYATDDYSGIGLAEMALNLRRPKVMREDRMDGKRVQYEDKEASKEASLKMRELSDQFVGWAKTSNKWAPKLARAYNDEKNGTLLRTHSEPAIDVYPNASPVNADGELLRLRPHQKIAVSRALQESVLLAYGVGTGKTYILITAAMEMRRIGTARKPVIVVHNQTVDQFRNSFKLLYPGAKVLIPDMDQRSSKMRKKTLISIATGDWDAIVLPQSFFDGIANDPARETAFVDEQLDMIEDAIADAIEEEGANSWTVKDLVKLKERRRQRLEALLDRRKDEVLTFEEMGVDALLVDEIHAYKRSEFYTKLNKVKGIDGGSSQRSTSLILKSEHVREKTGGKNVITATGTPISNTLAELWTMLRYVRPDLLEEYGVAHFDDFATTFGDIVEDTEETASGFKEVERFAKYINGPELLSMFFSGTDVRLTKDADLKLPKIIGGKPQAVVNEKSPELTAFIKGIIDRWRAWEKLPGREKMKERHVPLTLYNLAKKAAVDMRLIDPKYYKDEPNSKINRATDKIYKIWRAGRDNRTTQIVFLDLIYDNAKTKAFNLHKDLQAKLVEQGIPADEVELFSMASNEKKQEAIKERIRKGQSRVIIGTTAKLGIGVDIADKMVAAHHLNVPDRPMDIEQRDGRIWRQSNKNEEIEIFHYATKDTLDSVMFNRLMRKQKGADQVLTGDIDGRDFDDPYSVEQATFGEFAAAASGQAGKLLFEKNDLLSKEHKYRIAEQSHIRKISDARRNIQQIPDLIDRLEAEKEAADKLSTYVQKTFPAGKVEDLTLDGETRPRKEVYGELTRRISDTIEQWGEKFIGRPVGDFAKQAPKDMRGVPTLREEFQIQAGDIHIAISFEAMTNYDRKLKPSKKLKWAEVFNWNEKKTEQVKTGDIFIRTRYKGKPMGMPQYAQLNNIASAITRSLNKDIEQAKASPGQIQADIDKAHVDLIEFKNIAQEKFRYKQDLVDIRRRISEINTELTQLDSNELASRGEGGAAGRTMRMPEEAEAERVEMPALTYPTRSYKEDHGRVMRTLKNALMRMMVTDLELIKSEIDDWKNHIGRTKNTPRAVVEATKEFLLNYDHEMGPGQVDMLDRLLRNAQQQANEAQMAAVIGEPTAPGIPADIDDRIARLLPKGVTRFAMTPPVERRALDANQVRNVQRAAKVVTSSLAKAGLPKALREQIKIDFKPIIDLRGKDIEKTVADWRREGKNVSTILGATTFYRFNALMELSLEQDLASMERTSYHEALHVLASWVLPDTDYGRLMKLYKGNEEAAAEGFADFMVGRSKPMGVVRRIFLALRNLLQKVGGALRGAGFNSAEDIFGKLAARAYPGARSKAAATGTSISLMAEQRAQQWYSQMERHLRAKLPGKGTPQQIKKLLDTWASKGQIRDEELEWSGLREWLDAQSGKIDKAELLSRLADGRVGISEVVKSGGPDAGDNYLDDVTFEGGNNIPTIHFGQSIERPVWADHVDEDPDSVRGNNPQTHFSDKEIEELRNWQQENEAYREHQIGPEYMGGAVRDMDIPQRERHWADTPGGRYTIESDLQGVYVLERDGEKIAEHTHIGDAYSHAEEDLAERWHPNVGGTRYDHFTMPGGRNYAELLLTLPVMPPANLKQYIEQAKRPMEGHGQTYQSPHWQESNVLAHVRFNERTGPDGERILFIEEIQSDWHQAGRTSGYKRTPYTEKDFEKEFITLEDGRIKVILRTGEGPTIEFYSGLGVTESHAVSEALTRANRITGRVPDAPFKKTWPLLAIKRMVRYAAENGFDTIAWTPGEVQADRYDLRKQVREINWKQDSDGSDNFNIQAIDHNDQEVIAEKDITLSRIADLVGKDIAEKIKNSEGTPQKNEYHDWRSLSGLDLKVGGEGMRGFYDKILPAAVNRFFGKKAWGKAKVQTTAIDTNDNLGSISGHDAMAGIGIPTDQRRDYWAGIRQVERDRLIDQERLRRRGTSVWSLPITPEMRKRTLGEGMTLFKGEEDTDVFGAVLPENVAEQMEAARGRDKASAKQRFSDWIKAAIATFTPGQMYPQMDNKSFGIENETLRRFVEIASYSKARTVMDLKEILNPKKLGPAGYDLFNLKIVLDDMLYDVETEGRPLYDWKERHGELPFGFKDADQLRASLAKIDERVAANKDVQAALKKRRLVMRNLRKKLVAKRLLPKSVLVDERYFHHEVLQYANMPAMAGTGTGARDVRTKKKGWQIYRTGSLKDYNTEYMQSEFKVLAQGYTQLETQNILDELDASSNIIKELRADTKSTNKANFYKLAAKYYSKMFDKKITPAEVQADHKLDPLFTFRRDIAIGFGELANMAFNDKLSVPPEFDRVVDELADRHMGKKLDTMEDMHAMWTPSGGEQGAIWALLNHLIKTDGAGSKQAASIFKAITERNEQIEKVLGKNFVTWEQLMQERDPREGSTGWDEWIPKPGSAWYMTNSLTDKLLEQINAGIPVSEDEIRKVWTRGTDKRWVVPTELAEVLNGKEFLNLKQDNVVAAAAEKSLNWWKRWILINPFRIFKYNFNNLSGDLDITLAYDPKILKWTKQAAKDLWAYHYDKPLKEATKAELNRALKHAVIGSGMTVHDIPDINDMAQFDQLVSALRADKRKGIDYIKRFWEGSKNFTTWRENVLRLAAYRFFQSQLRAGKRVYAASDPAKVDAVTDEVKRAALLARELIGDYGGLSKGGQWLRRKAIPFYSWMEINAPRYWRMFKNLPIEGEPQGRRLRMGGALAKKAAVTTTKMAMFYAMVQAFNHLVWPDEEEELGEVGRRQLHLILGRRPDGSIISVRMQGALSDALSWLGAEDVPQDLADVRSGKKQWWELLTEAPVSTANRIVQGIRPDVKVSAEIATGRQVFPDVTKPRPIRDRYEHLVRMFSLEPIYRHLAGKPLRGDNIAEQIFEDLAATVTATHDPGQVAFHQAKGLAIEYLNSQGIERPMVDPTNRSNALFYYRKAIQLGDTAAAVKYLKAYRKLGGKTRSLKASIKRQHPLAGLPKKYRMRFMASLTPADRETVKRAIAWYRKVY